MPTASPANFDRIARPYRWLEYLTFGPMLERCRFYRIPQLTSARRALVLGDGDGRFLARLLAANPSLHADAIDQSPAMLRLLESRAESIGARTHVHIHRGDALAFQPSETYDLVATHFFLDCLSTEQVQTLASRIRPHLAPNAIWIVSEFAIPSGPAALPARFIVAALYTAFRVITGLRTRALPDYAAALARERFTLVDRKHFLRGLIVSDLWQLQSVVAAQPSATLNVE
jgi:SAM-dependent methyltransferase